MIRGLRLTYCFSKESLEYYRSLRIHKEKSLPVLVHHLLINQSLKYDFLVDNSHTFMNSLYRTFGTTISNAIVKATIGSVFTAGEHLRDVRQKFNSKEKGISLILDYCSECVSGQKLDERFFDESARVFQGVGEACAQGDGMFALKVSSLIDMELLKQISQARERVLCFFEGESMTVQNILEKLRHHVTISEQDEQQFISQVLNLGPNDTMTRNAWRYKVHPVYLLDDQKNKLKIIQYFNGFNPEQALQFDAFARRIKLILEPTEKHNVQIMVDAEQTYIQQAIDSFSEQLEDKYNSKDNIRILNTIQNYLKSSISRVQYEIAKAKEFGVPIGLKLVRGAYMVEERRIVKGQDPINENFKATTKAFETNLDQLLQFAQNNPICLFVASHNEETVNHAKELLNKYDLTKHKGINFAQLYALSDHLTYSLKDQGYNIYKYVPFGKTEIMIPYLIRRAQETKKVLQSSKLQRQLLVDELMRRLR